MSPESFKRKLTAILSADVKGYSRLMGEFCGVYKDLLILRLGEEKAAEALTLPHIKPFDITGRPMKGWVMVDERGFASEKELKDWLEKAKAFVKTLTQK